MAFAASRFSPPSVRAGLVAGSALVLGTLAAPALAIDSSTSVSATAPVMRGTSGRQLWRLADYTTIELVAREPGSAANEHPFMVEPNALHAWLQQVTLPKPNGLAKPLFAIDELSNLVPSIVAALANARPDQDIALVSSSRHEDNTFYGITAVTARLFVVDGHVNLIVHDTRVDFYDAARGSGLAPHFTVGSRTDPGTSAIQSATATSKRADWLVLNTVAPAAAPAMANGAAPAAMPAAAPPAAMAPTTPPAAMAPAAPVMAPAAPMAAPAPLTAAPAGRPMVSPPPAAQPAAIDPEQRLVMLKRLYDKGLITKPEYDRKRAEIIKGL